MIEEVIEAGVKAYRRNYKNVPEGIRLSRHEPVMLQGIEFTCWREYAVYKMGEYLIELCPEVKVEVELDGNNSIIKMEVTDEQQQEVNRKLYTFLKEAKLI